MASTFRIEHLWDVPRDVVVAHIFDDELARRTGVAIKSVERHRTKLEHRDDGTVFQHCEVKATSVPGVVAKVIPPEQFSWAEESVWHPEEGKFHWTVLLNALKGKFECAGTQWYEDLGNGKTRRVVEGHINIKVPLVGGKIEKIVIGNLKDSYQESSDAEEGYFKEQA